MSYSFLNNFNTFYYNVITNFYLVLNMFLPYYDDVIITFQKEALCDLFNNEENPRSFKEVKRNRLINFLKDLNDDVDKILIHDDNSLQIIYLPFVDEKVEDYSDYDQCDKGSESEKDSDEHNESCDKKND